VFGVSVARVNATRSCHGTANGAVLGSTEALLFDFDGTLWDCEPLVFRAYDEYFQRYGQRLPVTLWWRLMGTVDVDPWSWLEESSGQAVDRRAAAAAVDRRKSELLATGRPRAGVLRCLAEADALGLRRGIVSNSRRSWIAKYGRQCGIDRGWQFVESADGDPARAKPSPALYQAALARLGVGPHRVVAFEDSPSGVRAAKLAGLRCVAVSGTLTSGLDFAEADLRIDCFDRTGLRPVLDTLAGAESGG
jgi:beta-phosphoglucomutase-like phosphatase (HAD superfamily)